MPPRLRAILILIFIVAQFFSSGLLMNAVSTRIDGISGAFNRKPGLLDSRLVQAVDPFKLAQHCDAQLQAVIDLRGGREVEQNALQLPIFRGEINAADSIGIVLFLRQVGSRAARCTVFGQRKYR